MMIIDGIKPPEGHEKLCPALESHGVLCYYCREYLEAAEKVRVKARRLASNRRNEKQMTLDEQLSRDLHGDRR